MPITGGAVSARNNISLNGPVAVPADYVGATFRAYPYYNPTWHVQHDNIPSQAPPPPTGMEFGFVRVGTDGTTNWFQLELTAGSYDATALAVLDETIRVHRAAGRTVMFNLAYTPRFYAASGEQNLPPGAPTIEQGNGAYPGNTAPNGMTGLANITTFLMNRYNAAGGTWRTANPTLGKGLQYLELWNEPNWAGYPGFFWGTPSQMVDMCHVVRTAAKAVDPAIVFVAPATQSAFQAFQFWTANGTLYPGVTGASVTEIVNYHHYNGPNLSTRLDGWNKDFLTDGGKGLLTIRDYMRQAGIAGVPIMMGEGGFEEAVSSTALTKALNQPASWRMKAWARNMMIGAAYGLQKWVMYCWEGPFAAFPMNDPNGVPAALTLIHQKVAGKTILSCFYLPGAEVTLNFSDGTSLTV